MPSGDPVIHVVFGGLLAAAGFLWESLFGLVFGFLVSAIVQVAVTPAAMHRYLGPNLRGLLYATGFGIVSSACSYGAAAAARGFYQKGADIRSVFAFLVSSTNMNLAIVVLFWTMLGWRFAFAEFFGGILIIAIVTVGLRLLLGPGELNRLRREHPLPGAAPAAGSVVEQCPACGMEGEEQYAATHRDVSYWACSAKHQADVQRDLEGDAGSEQSVASGSLGWAALRRASTWNQIASTARDDVRMLRTELIVGYLIAGYAAALIPPGALARVLHAVGAVPAIGYVLLLAVGLLVAIATFVCSMGNVPVARVPGDRRDPARREHKLHLRRPADTPPPRDLSQVVSAARYVDVRRLLRARRDGGRCHHGAGDRKRRDERPRLDGDQRALHRFLEWRGSHRRARGCRCGQPRAARAVVGRLGRRRYEMSRPQRSGVVGSATTTESTA